MSLHDIWNKINPPPSQVEIFKLNENGGVESFPLFRKLFVSIIIILVASLSFGIGRLSVMGNREPIKIEYDPEISNQASISVALDNIKNSKLKVENFISVVTSKNGVRYHYLHCAGAKQIKEENKIVFATPAAAEAAGYTLAANCKPK